MAEEKVTLATEFAAQLDSSFDKILVRLDRAFGKLDKSVKGLDKTSEKMERTGRKLAKGLKKIEDASAQMNKQIGKSGAGVRRLLNAMKVTTAYGIAAGGIYRFVGALQTASREIVDFDQALKNIQAISGATANELAGMEKVMMDLAVETKFSTTEIAQGMVYLSQSGLDASESLQAIRSVATLAAGTLSSLALTSDLITTTIRAFNLEAVESARIADVMASAINGSKLTIDKLRTAFNYVGAASAQVGLSLEQTGASMMVLANNGLRASTIGTGMRQVLSRLMAPSRKLRETFDNFGISLKSVNPRLVGFEKAIMNMAKVIWDHDKQVVNMQKAYELFGLRGAQAAAIITKAFVSGDWDAMKAKLEEMGSAERMMAIQAEGAAFKIKNLSDRLIVLAQVLASGGLLDLFKGLVDTLRDLTDVAVRLTNTLGGRIVINITLLTAAAFTLVKAVTVLLGLFKSFGLALLKINPIIATLSVAASVLIGVFSSLSAQKKINRDQAIKLAAALKGELDSLRKFKKMLAETKEGGEEYNRILKRLIQAHPELADKIDVSRASQEQLNEVFREFEMLKTAEMLNRVTEAYIEQVDILGEVALEMQEASRQLEEYQYRVAWRAGKAGGNYFIEQKNIITAAKYALKDLIEGEEGYKKDAESATNKYVEATGKLREIVVETASQMSALGFASKDAMYEYLNQAVVAKAKTEEERLSLENFVSLVVEKATMLDRLKKSAREVGRVVPKGEGAGEGPPELGDFKSYYDKLDAIGKAWLLREIQRLEKRKKATRKFAEEMGLDAVETNEILAGLNAELMTKVENEFFKAKRETIKDSKKSLIEYLNWELDQLEEHTALREKQARTDAGSEKELMDELFSIRRTDFNRRRELMHDLLLLKEESLREEAEAEKRAIAKTKTSRVERNLAYIRLDNALKARLLKNQAEFNAAIAKMLRDLKTTELEYLKSRMDEWLATGRITVEKYLEIMEQLKNEGLVPLQEYLDAVNLHTGSMFNAFVLGMQKSLRNIKTWKQEFEKLGSSVIDVLADKSVSLWSSIIDGSEDATEAIKKWAKSMLEYISQVILKLLILKALKFVLGGGSAGATSGSGAVGGGVEWGHSGRWPGKQSQQRVRDINPEVFRFAPKLHTGLRADEMAAIIKKNEYVLTPQQMRDVVNSRQGGLSISVPISISDESSADRLKKKLPQAIESTVLRVMRQQMV